MPTPKQVKQYVEIGSPCEHLGVEGDGQHFFITIVSVQFEDKRLIQHHQLIYAALGERMRVETYVLSMKAFTPAGWQP